VGEIGLAVTNINLEGEVKIHGEYWKAIGKQKIKKNEKVKVVDVAGLELIVEKHNH